MTTSPRRPIFIPVRTRAEKAVFGVIKRTRQEEAEEILARPDAWRPEPITGREAFNPAVLTPEERGNQALVAEVQRLAEQRQRSRMPTVGPGETAGNLGKGVMETAQFGLDLTRGRTGPVFKPGGKTPGELLSQPLGAIHEEVIQPSLGGIQQSFVNLQRLIRGQGMEPPKTVEELRDLWKTTERPWGVTAVAENLPWLLVPSSTQVKGAIVEEAALRTGLQKVLLERGAGLLEPIVQGERIIGEEAGRALKAVARTGREAVEAVTPTLRRLATEEGGFARMGAAGEDFSTLAGIDSGIKKGEATLRRAREAGMTESTVQAIYDDLEALRGLRDNHIRGGLGDTEFQEYQALQQRLGEALEEMRAPTGGVAAPHFGTPERTAYDAARQEASQAGRRFESATQRRSRLGSTVRSLRSRIEHMERQVDEAAPRVPRAEPGQPEAGVQAGMMGVPERAVRPRGKGVEAMASLETAAREREAMGRLRPAPKPAPAAEAVRPTRGGMVPKPAPEAVAQERLVVRKVPHPAGFDKPYYRVFRERDGRMMAGAESRKAALAEGRKAVALFREHPEWDVPAPEAAAPAAEAAAEVASPAREIARKAAIMDIPPIEARTARPAARQPWEMTRVEFVQTEGPRVTKTPGGQREMQATARWRIAVENAIKEGKAVPEEVKASYVRYYMPPGPKPASEVAEGVAVLTEKFQPTIPRARAPKPAPTKPIAPVAEGVLPPRGGVVPSRQVEVAGGLGGEVTGQPASVKGFHGTKAQFGDFDPLARGRNTRARSASEGIFFTDKPEIARGYADTGDIPATQALFDEAARLERIARHSGQDTDWRRYEAKMQEYEDAALRDVGGEARTVLERELRFENPLVVDAGGRAFSEVEGRAIILRAKKAGHDGVIIHDVADAVTTPIGAKDIRPLSERSALYIPFSEKQIITKEPPGGVVRKEAVEDIAAAPPPAAGRLPVAPISRKLADASVVTFKSIPTQGTIDVSFTGTPGVRGFQRLRDEVRSIQAEFPGVDLVAAPKDTRRSRVFQNAGFELEAQTQMGDFLRLRSAPSPAAQAAEEAAPARLWETGAERPFAFDPNSTANQGRFRLLPPKTSGKYITRQSGTPGVTYIVDTDVNAPQAIRFNKSQFNERQAAQWWETNKGRFKFANQAMAEAAPAPGRTPRVRRTPPPQQPGAAPVEAAGVPPSPAATLPDDAEARRLLVEQMQAEDRAAGIGGGAGEVPPGKPPTATGGEGLGEGADPVAELQAALRVFKPKRAELERLYHQERVRRAAALGGIIDKPEGQATLFRALGSQRGPLAAKDVEPLVGRFTPGSIDFLFNKVWTAPNETLMSFEKLSTSNALQRLIFEGRIPTRLEMEHLEDIFGPELAKALMDLRPWSERARAMFFDLAGLPKALKASFDLSFGFRQGLVLINNPEWWRAWAPSIKAFASEGAALDVAESIASKQLYPLMQRLMRSGDFYLAPMGRITTRLSAREEMFFSGLANRIPFVKWSNRAYTTFGNKLRADYFERGARRILQDFPDVTLEANGLLKGRGAEQATERLKQLGKWTSHATGRGDLPRMGETLQALVNAGFFSPRFVTSRFQVAGEAAYGTARLVTGRATYAQKEAVRNTVLVVAEGIAALTLASLAGAGVERDPRSSDFGKIRIGKTTIDIWAGFQQPARYISQLVMGQRKSISSGKVLPQRRLETLYRFGESKQAPTAGIATTLLRGTDFVGEKLGEGTVQAGLDDLGLWEPASRAVQLLSDMGLPMTLEDLYEAVLLEGWLQSPVALPAAVGMGVQTYEINKGAPAHTLGGERIPVRREERERIPVRERVPVRAR